MKQLLLILLLVSLSYSEVEYEQSFTNTNFALNSNIAQEDYLYDYNRFRYNASIYYKDFSSKFIIDNETLIGNKYLNSALGNLAKNYSSDTPFDITLKLGNSPYDRLKLYRAYIQYEGDKHSFTFGLQRVAFGVGRVWTPVDMFNPLQSISLESSERAPVFAWRYGYALNDTSDFTFVISEQANHELKEAIRLKTNTGFADLAIVLVNERYRNMIGYEAAGALFDTGFELRSEGGSFYDTQTKKRFTKLIIGTDYSFENSLTLIAEYLYNENQTQFVYNPLLQSYSLTPDSFSDIINQKDKHYTALIASYNFSSLLSGMLLSIQNLVDASIMNIANLSYSLSDESTLMFGAFFSLGSSTTEFETLPNLLFFNYTITF